MYVSVHLCVCVYKHTCTHTRMHAWTQIGEKIPQHQITEFTRNKHTKATPQEKFDSSTLHIVFTFINI